MIKSMTGYGQSMLATENIKITAEIKSFNHRFCEVTTRMPRQFLVIEDQIKKLVQSHVARGKVDLFITVDGEGLFSRKLEVDWNLVEHFIQTAKKLEEQTGVSQKNALENLLLEEKLVTIVEEEIPNEQLQQVLLQAVSEAIANLCSMREKEGSSLFADLTSRINRMLVLIDDLISHAPKVANSYRERLLHRVEEFLTGKLSIDESRLLTEVAIFADKSNIDEELTRITSHCYQFLAILEEDGTVGRKLDFIVQELNREANTIGAKANDIHISKQVVELKSEIEKIKEQVQNIE
ncbi:YicC/YloC family endoribonuclease [Bacillus alkalicellulosilyticus]|uniref:YicC/YloC family endoribonuclease n=1 Tax=Alkalihalobacterium alkalicellulosilyticum TaxID=1912214 RepID=UPI000998AE2F|nr:YicC/YloC family endoribonuclease [Bacillus alkalicellulosilyticus]